MPISLSVILDKLRHNDFYDQYKDLDVDVQRQKALSFEPEIIF
jgi:hypothetical protein